MVSEAYLKARKNLNSLWEETCDILPINGASVVGNGRPVPTIDAQGKSSLKYHDFIHFLPKSKENIYSISFPLYEQGISLREIERQTGFARTSIQNVLSATGLPKHKNKKSKKIVIKRHNPKVDLFLSGLITLKGG